MFLKRVVLHGFKSFVDRTELDFGPGMTSIVGPNGCGKSNVLDAIRWVLGEQSAKTLRGARMQDVIFGGCRTRKAANFAEVRLTFDNSAGFLARDEAEVVVGRILYGNGDSEYQINGNTCRLKDVRELMLDTGVGVDAYSMIEQGRVDALLKANPTERREIFEEAAGISRYKARRVEAQRKLERSQNNLLRLNDLVDELEKRLRSVKLAAGKARRFQELDGRLRELRAGFSLAEYHRLEQSRAVLRSRFDALHDVVNAKRAGLAQRDAAATEVDAALLKLDEQIQAAEAELRQAQAEASAMEERIAQGALRIEELQSGRDRQRTHATDADTRAAQLEERFSEENHRIAELRETEQAASERVAATEAQRREIGAALRATRETLEQARSAAFEAARRAALLANNRHTLEQEQRRQEVEILRLAQRRSESEERLAQTRRRGENLAADERRLLEQADVLAADVKELDRAAASLQAERARLEDAMAVEKERRGGVSSRLRLLEEMEARREGVQRGARWVLEWDTQARESAGVVGLVADLMRIDDPRVRALQPVLARFETDVVVRRLEPFLQAVAAQADAPPGPVSIIALDRLPRIEPIMIDRGAAGFVAGALDWTLTSDRDAPLAERLLRHVTIFERIEHVLSAEPPPAEGLTLVTLDGHVYDGWGRLTVSAGAEAEGLISRKAEIRQLGGELDEIETRLERAARRRNELESQHSDQQTQRGGLLDELAGAQKRHAEARHALARASEDAARLSQEVEALNAEIAAGERSADELLARTATCEAEREASEARRAALEREVEQRAAGLREQEASEARAAEALTQAQVEAGRTTERREAGESALRDLREQVQRLRAEHDAAAQEAERMAQRMADAARELERSRARRAELAALVEAREQAALARRQARQALRRKAEAFSATARRLQDEIDQVESAQRSTELELREAEIRRENLVTRVQEELSISLERVYRDYEHAEQDWDAARSEMEALREKLERLGHVNLDAITELEELTPRFENLTRQRADLVSSIAQLEQLICELDDESRARFLQAFEEIRENFGGLFRKLFGGGKADVVLLDAENPLECGIEIVARPPGKEPKSISLLSGGERTMAAVALLFAVFKRKPSPFAILDEVDAALDESNIDRFNSMLQEFLAQSQFVLITHNKRTMQNADTLYGITMEEPGVSKRVSVRFDDRVEAPHVA